MFNNYSVARDLRVASKGDVVADIKVNFYAAFGIPSRSITVRLCYASNTNEWCCWWRADGEKYDPLMEGSRSFFSHAGGPFLAVYNSFLEYGLAAVRTALDAPEGFVKVIDTSNPV